MEMFFGILYIIVFSWIAYKCIRKKEYNKLFIILLVINYGFLSFFINDKATDNFIIYVIKKVFDAICMFIGALDYESVINNFYSYIPFKIGLKLLITYQFVISIFYSIAFIINYFSFILDGFIFSFYRKNLYVFSCLNKESLMLAKSILKKNKKAHFLICNVDYKDEISTDFIDDIKKCRALLTKKDIHMLNLNKKDKIQLFISSRDDYKNINDLEKILNKSKINKDIIIYPFIKSRNSEIFLDNYIDKNMKIHAINEVDMMIYDVVWKEPILPKNNNINILIVGSGIIGKQFLKAIYWCCNIPNVNLNITIISDNIDKAINYFINECPEVFNKIYQIEKNLYQIRNKKIQFKNIDVNEQEFNKYISYYYDYFTYYFVALGSDSLNAEVCVRIRELLCKKDLEHINVVPITTIIMDDSLAIELSNASVGKNNNNQKINYCIKTFGNYKSIYCYENIIRNNYFKAGLNVSKIIKGKENINDYQCNYRSSIAFVLSLKYKIFYMNNCYLIGDYDENSHECFKDVLYSSQMSMDAIAKNEHERWRCFYEMEGFESISIDKIKKYKDVFGINNYMAKYHPALCNYEELEERNEIFKTHYIDNDKRLIENVDKIIEGIFSIKKR